MASLEGVMVTTHCDDATALTVKPNWRCEIQRTSQRTISPNCYPLNCGLYMHLFISHERLDALGDVLQIEAVHENITGTFLYGVVSIDKRYKRINVL